MRQMMCADEEVAGRDRHVLRQLSLDRHVCLVRIRIFEVLTHVQREGQNRTESWEGLIVETLPAELVLRARGNTRRDHTGWTDRRYWSARRTNSSLKYL